MIIKILVRRYRYEDIGVTIFDNLECNKSNQYNAHSYSGRVGWSEKSEKFIGRSGVTMLSSGFFSAIQRHLERTAINLMPFYYAKWVAVAWGRCSLPMFTLKKKLRTFYFGSVKEYIVGVYRGYQSFDEVLKLEVSRAGRNNRVFTLYYTTSGPSVNCGIL